MNHRPPDLLQAARLPMLCRGVCLYAGLPLQPASVTKHTHFVVRTGDEPPQLLARLLEEGFLDDDIEIVTTADANEAVIDVTSRARIRIRPGFSTPCPDVKDYRSAVAAENGPILFFCVEQLDDTGKLLSQTWAAIPEEESCEPGLLRSAVKSYGA